MICFWEEKKTRARACQSSQPLALLYKIEVEQACFFQARTKAKPGLLKHFHSSLASIAPATRFGQAGLYIVLSREQIQA